MALESIEEISNRTVEDVWDAYRAKIEKEEEDKKKTLSPTDQAVTAAALPVLTELSHIPTRLLPYVEKSFAQRISKHSNAIEGHHSSIKKSADLTQKINRLFAGNKGKKEIEITDEFKSQLNALEYKDLDQIKKKIGSGNTISSEDLEDLKSAITSSIDELKSKIQIDFSSKLQPDIQKLQAFYESIKAIQKRQDQMMQTIMYGS